MEHARLFRATWPTFVRKLRLVHSLLPWAARGGFRAAGIAFAMSAAACGPDIGVTGPSQANPLDVGEQAVFDKINAHRVTSGASALTLCKSLNVSASAHSDDMRDKAYQSDTGLDGSTTMTRACAAGYAPGCTNNIMAEVIASGSDDAEHTVGQWQADDIAAPILVNMSLTVVGVGRTFREDESSIWTVDFGGLSDPSCL